MKSSQIDLHIQQLKQQRDVFYHDKDLNFDEAWKRPKPDKWSIGETLYHLVLLARLFRRFSIVYIPVMLPVAHLRKKKAYKTEIHDIYQDFQQQRKKPMNAPFLIKPPAGLEEKYSFVEVKELLKRETEKLIENLQQIEQDIAGQIYYPDPIAGYPNLIQSVHLLAIHENHHFQLVKKYYC